MKKQYWFLILILLAGKVFAQNVNTYDKLWNDPEVVSYIKNNTEKYRKGDISIQVLNSKGEPVKGAVVETVQTGHEFLFGCNLFALGQLDTPELNTRYEEGFAGLFNFATVPFYWGDLEPQEGKPRFAEGSESIWRRPPPDQLLNWCNERGILPKGHALMYAKNIFMPEWTKQDNPDEFLKQAHQHIAGIAERYGDSFPIWDVANEEMPRARHPEEWHKVPDDYLVWCFREADQLFSKNVKMLYNDGTYQAHDDTDEYLDLFRMLKKNNARVDGMGIQFHAYNREAMLVGEELPPKQLIDVYKKLEETELPLYITEITIPGRDENGEMFQAKIVENLYRLWFSTPNMAGLTWWNLGDGTAYKSENNAKGGLMDENMLPKAAYKALDNLINHEWRTNISLSTNKNGEINFRGFYGKYKVVIKYKEKTIEKEISPSKSGDNNFTIQL